jgi:hypothetical protein
MQWLNNLDHHFFNNIYNGWKYFAYSRQNIKKIYTLNIFRILI